VTFEEETAPAWDKNNKMRPEGTVLDGVDCSRVAEAGVNKVINLLKPSGNFTYDQV
jgi:hypothetical protein